MNKYLFGEFLQLHRQRRRLLTLLGQQRLRGLQLDVRRVHRCGVGVPGSLQICRDDASENEGKKYRDGEEKSLKNKTTSQHFK
jgi:hypothetical protein